VSLSPERVAAIVGPDHTAVIAIEMQESVVGPGSGLPELAAAARAVGLADHVAKVVRGARAAGATVIHATAESLPGGFGANSNARLFGATRKAGMENRPGSVAARPVAELGPEPGDQVLARFHGLSPMTGTPLDHLLRNAGITTVVVTGVSLNVAVPNLVFDAVNRAYQAVVVTDAVVGVPPAYGEQVLAHSLSVVATLLTTDELLSAWGAG